jgi:ankyrin repeat protein
MEENLDQNTKKGFTNKQIAVGVAVAVLSIGAIHQYNKISVKDEAKSALKAGADSLKDKFHGKVAGIKDKMREREEKFNTPTVDIDGRNMAENRFIETTEHNGQIELNKLSMSAKNADLLLLSAVQAGDIANVKSYVEQGINLNFTNNKLCVQHDTTNESVDVPANIDQLKQAVRYQGSQGGYTLMTDCSKLFILESVKGMHASTGSEEVYTMNNYGFTDEQIRQPDSNPWKQQYLNAKQADLDSIKRKQSKEDVFNYLVDHTDFYRNDNFTQLPYVFRNGELPFSVRIKALRAYMDVLANPARIKHVPNVDAYNQLSNELVDSVAQGAQAGSYNAQVSAQVKNELENSAKANSKMDADFKVFVNEYVATAGKYNALVKDLNVNGSFNTEMKGAGVSYQPDLELSLAAFKDNGITYEKNKRNMLYYANKGFGNGFYLAEKTNYLIKCLNMMLDSQLVNVNRQYYDGSTILHYLADYPNIVGAGENEGQAIGVLNRYMLNKGANPNLLNKKGQTALEIAMNNNQKSGGVQTYKPILASYQDINYQK